MQEIAKSTAKLTVSPVRYADKLSPGKRLAEKVNLVSNVWGVLPQKNVPIYRYDVRIIEEFPPKKTSKKTAEKKPEVPFKEVTKNSREDYVSIERKNKCVAIFVRVVNREKAFFGKMDGLVYDRASILYSLDVLDVKADEVKTFEILPSELPKDVVNPECTRVLFNVKPCTEDFQLTMYDLKQATEDTRNRSLLSFFELLASQEAFFTEGAFVTYGTGQDYLYEPGELGFTERDMPPLPDGKYIGIGASKSVKLVEGPRGPGGINAALVMDVKKAAFHIENQTVVEKISLILQKDPKDIRFDPYQIQILKKMLRGIYVRCVYGKHRTFKIHNICTQNADQMRFDVVGKDQQKKKISVAEYFKTNVGIALKFARLPLIIERCESGENYYPMELLVVCENQRVKQTQQSSEQIQAMISACAALPSDRKRQTSIMTEALKLDGATKNRWFDEYNVKITKNLALEGRVLPSPQIEYGRNVKTPVNPERTSWIASKNTYLYPAICERWYCVALVSSAERGFNEPQQEAYVNAFIQQCRQHGMQIGKPIAQLYVRGATENQVDVHMNKAKQMGAKLVHFITSDKLLFHGRMKLLEASEQIVTLDLKTSTAVKAPQKWQTLDNIINKVNLKLGGINFGLRLETEGAQKSIMNPNRIIVGMDVAHPPAINRRRDEENLVPSIVGYSSNCKKHPLDFIGGYRYARANQEEIADSTITDLMVESMKKFRENRNILPNHIILLRDGISEGQYTYVIQNEVEQVKSACGQIGGNAYRPHITFVVATKMHNLRLFKKDIPRTNKASEQNIKPGTIVDKHIVSPVLNEFYLNSHSAFQGTAKTPRYTKLFDTSKMSNDEIQAIVFALAFNHQIVNSAVSLPAPIFIADRMATRGQNNFVAQFGDISEGSEGAAKAPMDLKELNAQLGYADKPLSNCRFNA